MDVDILISGHTHAPGVSAYENKCFINPGSLTGAYNGMNSEVIPSFILMDIDGSKAMTWTYTLTGNMDDLKCEQQVEKRNFTKEVDS